jgi:hypothetical protein
MSVLNLKEQGQETIMRLGVHYLQLIAKQIRDSQDWYNPQCQELGMFQSVFNHHEELYAFVETGTADGAGILEVERMIQFSEYHTIELSPEMYSKYEQSFKESQVKRYLGNSTEVLPEISAQIEKPSLFYLDAHYCKGYSVEAGNSGSPLMEELEIIAKRELPDLVIVDDAGTFDTPRPDLKAPDTWLGVTFQKIEKRLPHAYWSYRINGEFIIHCGENETTRLQGRQLDQLREEIAREKGAGGGKWAQRSVKTH